MFLWASRFVTAKIECSLEMGKYVNTFGGNIYFAGDGTYLPGTEVKGSY